MDEFVSHNLLSPTSLRRPWYRRWWAWLLVLLVAAWLVVPYLLPAPEASTQSVGEFTAAPGQGTRSPVVLANVVTTDDPSHGPATAPVVVVEFGDFQCPFCRESAPIIRQVLAKYPEAVRLIFRDFPVPELHPEAVSAAEAANCAGQQDTAGRQNLYWQFHDALYSRQDELGADLYQQLAQQFHLNLDQFNHCLDSDVTLPEIQADVADATKAGVHGTPTWFVNGHKIEGSLPLDLWNKVVLAALKEKFNH